MSIVPPQSPLSTSPSAARVSVILVTWNSADVLPLALQSLAAQNIPLEIIVVDQASGDGSADVARAFPATHVIAAGGNLGFCGGNNLGLKAASGEFVLLLNPDAVLTPGYVQCACEALTANPQAALFTGKVLRMTPAGEPISADGQAVIDTTGIQLHANRQAVDRGQGEPDHGQYDEPGRVFGVCGAVLFARTAALREAAVDGEVFDEAFFAYKEDVDLSWRLRHLGWQAIYDPAALAYHARGWKTTPGARGEISRSTRYHSFKNRRLMILKNETWKTFLRSALPILAFEVAALGYALLREPYLLPAYGEIRQYLPRIRQWRREIARKIAEKNSAA